jgi:hypothetical protein
MGERFGLGEARGCHLRQKPEKNDISPQVIFVGSMYMVHL